MQNFAEKFSYLIEVFSIELTQESLALLTNGLFDLNCLINCENFSLMCDNLPEPRHPPNSTFLVFFCFLFLIHLADNKDSNWTDTTLIPTNNNDIHIYIYTHKIYISHIHIHTHISYIHIHIKIICIYIIYIYHIFIHIIYIYIYICVCVCVYVWGSLNNLQTFSYGHFYW